MFVLAKEFQFTWPVRVRVPTDDGEHAIQTFTARFRLLSHGRAAALGGDARALLDAALVGWEGIATDGGGVLQVTEAAKAALLDHPFVLVALAEAYADALSGKAAAKN